MGSLLLLSTWPLLLKMQSCHLINLAKSSNIYAIEMGITALANLLLDRQIAEEALADDIIPPLSRVLREGTIRGKQHVAAALARLVCHGPVDDVFIEGIHHCGTVLNLASLLCATNLEGKVTEEALEALSLLAKENRGGALNCSNTTHAMNKVIFTRRGEIRVRKNDARYVHKLS
jgi:hypothetical protein